MPNPLCLATVKNHQSNPDHKAFTVMPNHRKSPVPAAQPIMMPPTAQLGLELVPRSCPDQKNEDRHGGKERCKRWKK
ncbi:hypothetical protein M0R45_025894 [Rubus argutus]|uniref:Uncharacterized protein n=1 Tax=Rubus argutus TaxID=59490 RepID=A0AAW1WXD7_RUBAR